jgi:hypothetical protein
MSWGCFSRWCRGEAWLIVIHSPSRLHEHLPAHHSLLVRGLALRNRSRSGTLPAPEAAAFNGAWRTQVERSTIRIYSPLGFLAALRRELGRPGFYARRKSPETPDEPDRDDQAPPGDLPGAATDDSP